MKIKIKYLRDVPELKQIGVGDWIDLCVAKTVILSRNETELIPLGIAMELPKGYEAIVAPRSSTFKRYGIIETNSIGIIDESYKGDKDEWHFPAMCIADGCVIPKGTRICQFRIIEHQPKIEFEKVEVLGNENRGGFGSTGYGDFNHMDG